MMVGERKDIRDGSVTSEPDLRFSLGKNILLVPYIHTRNILKFWR